jgi:hypothetical protein
MCQEFDAGHHGGDHHADMDRLPFGMLAPVSKAVDGVD